MKKSRIAIVFITFPFIVLAVLYFYISSSRAKDKLIMDIKKHNEFYFSGNILQIEKFSSFYNGLVIELDTAYFHMNKTVGPSLIHGLYSKDLNIVIFYSQFNNEVTANLPKYITVSSNTNQVQYVPSIEASNTIRMTKLYAFEIQKVAVAFTTEDWIYF